MSTKRYQYQSQFIIKTTKLGNLVGNSQLKYIASMYCIHLQQFLGHLKMYCISNTALASRLSCDKRQQQHTYKPQPVFTKCTSQGGKVNVICHLNIRLCFTCQISWRQTTALPTLVNNTYTCFMFHWSLVNSAYLLPVCAYVPLIR